MAKAQSRQVLIVVLAAAVAACPSVATGEDWPQWGGRDSRNMVSDAKGLPASFDPGSRKPGSVEIDPATTRNIKWTAKLGSQTYGSPAVVDGRIFLGTNDSSLQLRDPNRKGDGGGVVLCLDENTGSFLWHLVIPRKRGLRMFDHLSLGVCSSPLVDGDRVYVTSNRGEILCLDVKGMADGNDGPYKDEAQYVAGPGNPPVEPEPTDGDILWRHDIFTEWKISYQDAMDCSLLVHGDLLFGSTHNSRDPGEKEVPYPETPTVVALNKITGQVVAADDAEITRDVYHGQWSSPSLAKVGGRTLVFYGGGDGYCYAFDAEPKPGPSGGRAALKMAWKCDCNPPEYKSSGAKPIEYGDKNGPSEIIATPAYHEGRVYVSIGQDPRHGLGVGALTCIDATKTGDVSQTGVIWRYEGLDRSLSTASIADGLVLIADYTGRVHCLDADTGKCYWVHDTKGRIWGSTLVADGKVYVGNERRWLFVFAADKEKKVLFKARLSSAIYCTPVVANGVLYVASQKHLYAIEKQD